MVRQYVDNACNADMSLPGAAAWKGNPRGNPKGKGKETSRDRKHGDCTTMDLKKSQCSWADSFSFKHDFNRKVQEEDPVPLPKREDTRKETEQEIPRERTQRCQSLRTDKQAGMVPFSEGQCQKQYACDYWQPPECSHQWIQRWMQKEEWHTGKAGGDERGDATVAMHLDETIELNCVLEDGQGDKFSVQSILKRK